MPKQQWRFSWAWGRCGLILMCAAICLVLGERRAAALIAAQALFCVCLSCSSLERRHQHRNA